MKTTLSKEGRTVTYSLRVTPSFVKLIKRLQEQLNKNNENLVSQSDIVELGVSLIADSHGYTSPQEHEEIKNQLNLFELSKDSPSVVVPDVKTKVPRETLKVKALASSPVPVARNFDSVMSEIDAIAESLAKPSSAKKFLAKREARMNEAKKKH